MFTKDSRSVAMVSALTEQLKVAEQAARFHDPEYHRRALIIVDRLILEGKYTKAREMIDNALNQKKISLIE